MKVKWLCLLMGAVVMTACADERTVVRLWPDGQVPLKTSGAGERVTPSKDDIVRLTDVNDPTLTLFPASPVDGKPHPAVMICPGGGYGILAWNLEGTEIAEWLNKQGFSAFILKYRVPKNRDAAFCDAQRAMGMIRARAKEWNVDAARLGVMGFSAGAHLAVRLSTNHAKRFYSPVDVADSQPCRPDFALIIYPAYLYAADYKMAPELPVASDTPPTFLVQAEDDGPYVDSSLSYFIALKAAKVPAELHLFPNGGHGYGIRKHEKSTDVWPQLASAWLLRTCSRQ